MAEKKSTYEEGRLEGVTFLYTNIQTPKKKYESEDTEWAVNVVVTKAQAKMIKEKYPKKGDAKAYVNEDFVEQFGIDVPYPDEPIQYVYKFNRNTTYANGDAVPEEKAPRVIFTRPDGVNIDITKKVLVGNGSVGTLIYFATETKFGTFPKLKDIIVDKLVKYERKESGTFMEVQEASDEDLVALLGEGATNEIKATSEAVKASKDPVAKATGGVSSSVTDDDLPWGD